MNGDPPRTEPARDLLGTLLRGLLDDASLFPPGNLPMPQAIEAHARHRAAWYRDLSGPFVCPETRLPELRRVLTAAGTPAIDLSLVVTGGAAAVADAVNDSDADPRLRLRAIEVPIARGEEPAKAIVDVTTALDGAPRTGAAGYVEIPIGMAADPASARALIAIVAEHGYRPKLRTGGVTSAAFPDETTLAACLATVVRQWVPFKCTAGLHHAVRRTADETGFEHHGFLNMLLAIAAATSGADHDQVAGILRQRERSAIAGQVRSLSPDDIARVRTVFASFGTCSTDEPVADLVALGLIGTGGAGYEQPGETGTRPEGDE
ncbi:MAG: hypothetical protein ACYCVZ_09805 [Streptosporangiaceae bacterium]